MREVEPEVFLVAGTSMSGVLGSKADGLDDAVGDFTDYLTEVGAGAWATDAETDAERLVEVGGRLCYRAWAPGLNPNVTKVRTEHAKYIENILASKHGSVLEHASVSFIFHHVSRVFTHELVRHRAGCAVSQESMRYVRLTDLPFWWPKATLAEIEMLIAKHAVQMNLPGIVPTFREEAEMLLAQVEALQRRVGDAIDASGMDFAAKKRITSFLRRFAPDGVATGILWTANFRALRHVLALRTAPAAEEEMRFVFDRVGALCQRHFPAVFQDFSRQEDGAWVPANDKV